MVAQRFKLRNQPRDVGGEVASYFSGFLFGFYGLEKFKDLLVREGAPHYRKNLRNEVVVLSVLQCVIVSVGWL